MICQRLKLLNRLTFLVAGSVALIAAAPLRAQKAAGAPAAKAAPKLAPAAKDPADPPAAAPAKAADPAPAAAPAAPPPPDGKLRLSTRRMQPRKRFWIPNQKRRRSNCKLSFR